MTWFRQVLHVFRRDLRRTWLSLALYVVVLGLTVARAAEWSPVMHDALGPVGWLVTLCAVLATVRALLADDTTRADAFWAIQPLHASAVAASKLAYVLSLLMLYTGAMLILRAAWHLGPIGPNGAHSAYPVLTLTLLGMALASSVLRTMTSVSALAAGALGLAVLARNVLHIPQQSMATELWWPAVTALSFGCAAFVMRRYRARETTLLRRGAALGTGVVAMVFPAFGTLSLPVDVAVEFDPAHSLDSIALTLPVTTMPSCAGRRLEVPISVGAPLGWRVGLMRPTLDITRDDGSMLSLSAPNWMQLAGGQGPLLPTDRDRDGVRVVGSDPDLPELRTAIVFPLPAADSGRTCGHFTRLAMRMWVETETGIEVMRVPIRDTATAVVPGYRARIMSQVIGEPSVTIKIRLSGLTDDEARSPDFDGLSFALLNPERREIIQLTQARASDKTTTWETPGGLRQWGITLDLARYDGERPRIGGLESWRDGSVLLITRANTEGRGWQRSPTVTVP